MSCLWYSYVNGPGGRQKKKQVRTETSVVFGQEGPEQEKTKWNQTDQKMAKEKKKWR